MIYKSKIIEFIGKIIEKFGLLSLPIYWLSFLSIRNKKICVCGSTFGKGFTGNPKYFYLYLNGNKVRGIRAIWISRDDEIVKHLNNQGYESYNIYSIKGLYYSLIAKIYVFDHYSKDISFWMSGGSIKVNLWHGIPLKKGHKDNKFDVVRNPRNTWDKIRWVYRRIQNENPSYYYAVTSEYMRKIHTQAFAANYDRVFVCGYARNDVLVENGYLDNMENVIVNNIEFYKSIKQFKKDGFKIIIYMPTHRESERLLFDIVNFDELNLFLKEENIILLNKLHVRSKLYNKFINIDYSNILNINYIDDPYPYLKLSDALITDYSSVYFDYLLMDRPIIFFPYDLNIYMETSRELYYEYDSVTPGERVMNMNELIESMKKLLIGEDKYAESRRILLKQMFDYYDGKSSERLYGEVKKLIEIM